jgi:hypothetical protein
VEARRAHVPALVGQATTAEIAHLEQVLVAVVTDSPHQPLVLEVAAGLVVQLARLFLAAVPVPVGMLKN